MGDLQIIRQKGGPWIGHPPSAIQTIVQMWLLIFWAKKNTGHTILAHRDLHAREDLKIPSLPPFPLCFTQEPKENTCMLGITVAAFHWLLRHFHVYIIQERNGGRGEISHNIIQA
jgi:hypothetical protein